MKFHEAMIKAKEDPTKRITDGNIIFGYAPRFDQFYEIEYGRSVYFRNVSTRLLFEDGWEVVNSEDVLVKE